MAGPGNAKGPVVVIIGFLLIVVAWSSLFTVNERELAVVLEFGKPVRRIDQSGLYFKMPMIQTVSRLPRTRQFWASGKNDVLEALPTADGKKIEISVWAIWRITDPEQFVRELRSVENAEQQVIQRVRASVRDVLTSYDLPEVVRSTDRELTNTFGVVDGEVPEEIEAPTDSDSTSAAEDVPIRFGREKILEEIRQRIVVQLKSDESEGSKTINRGIEFIDVGVSNIGFAESVRKKAFERLAADMDAIAARYHNEGEQRKQEIINETKAEVEKLLGEGEEQSKRLRGEVEAEIIKLYAQAIKATGEFYNFQRTLAVYEAALSNDTRLILTTDSDLFRMLKQISDVEAAPASTNSTTGNADQ